MLDRLIAYLKKKYDNRPGKHLPGRQKTDACPDGRPGGHEEGPSSPDHMILFFLFILSDGSRNFVRLTMDKAYMAQPDAFRRIMERTARYYRLKERVEIKRVHLLTYDQYVQGVGSCPDPTPVELNV